MNLVCACGSDVSVADVYINEFIQLSGRRVPPWHRHIANTADVATPWCNLLITGLRYTGPERWKNHPWFSCSLITNKTSISANADGPRDAASGSRDVTTPLSGMVRRPQAGTNYTINLIPREAVVLHTYSTVAGVASDRPANFTLKGVHGVNTALR